MTVDWGAPLVATGGYWFGRNLASSGSPLPSVHLPFLASPHFDLVQQTGYSVFHYFGDGAVWRHWLLRGLEVAMGGWWWAILAASAAGILAGRRVTKVAGVVALAATASAVAYLFTPTTAGGASGAPAFF